MAEPAGSDPAGGGPLGGVVVLSGDLSGTNVSASVDAISGYPVIPDFAALSAHFPAVGGLHTIDKTTIWPNTSLIPLPAGNRIAWTIGSAVIGVVGAGVVGDYAGPLCSGVMLVHVSFTIFNLNAGGSDIAIDGTGAGPVFLDGLGSLGPTAGTIDNVQNLTLTAFIDPQIPGGTGLVLGGTIGSALINQTISFAPGVAPYTALAISPTATIVDKIVIGTVSFDSKLAGDVMFDFSTLATYPTGPLPTTTIGMFLQSPTLTGLGQMFAAGSVDSADIRLISVSANNGPVSRILGDASVDTSGTPPSIILVNSGSPANTKLVVPIDNSGNGGAGATLRTLALDSTISERHTIVTTGVQLWGIRYDGPLRDISTNVSWTAIIKRVGAIATVTGWLQYDDGGGWTTIERTRYTYSNLPVTFTTVGRSSVPFEMSPGTQFRLAFDTDTPATETEFESYEITISGRTSGG